MKISDFHEMAPTIQHITIRAKYENRECNTKKDNHVQSNTRRKEEKYNGFDISIYCKPFKSFHDEV